MRIWLVRHGEALGKLFPTAKRDLPDHAMPLTEFGADQAHAAGEKIRATSPGTFTIAYSPSLRTEQSALRLAKGLGEDRVESITPAPDIREHDKAGEPLPAVRARMTAFVASQTATDLVLVSHGVPLQELEHALTGHAEPKRGNAEVVLLEGDLQHGFTAKTIAPAQERSTNLPADYKTDPVGGWDALKTRFNYEKPPLGRG